MSHGWSLSSQPRAHVIEALAGWGLTGVATFSFILHPYGCHPLALLACTL